jgi:hypothetical protein
VASPVPAAVIQARPGTQRRRATAVDRWHGAFAGLGYVTLAATPLLAAAPLRRAGAGALSRSGLVAGAISAAALALTATNAVPHGLMQRLGLTASDAWIAASAIAVLGRRIGPVKITRSGSR